MRVAFFSAKPFDRTSFDACLGESPHEIQYFDTRLTIDTLGLAADRPAVCVFVNDQLNAEVLQGLSARGARFIALRCAGFNNVDLAAAGRLGFTVVRVPAYSPHAVAEFAVGLMLTLNRKIHKSYARVREGNFQLQGLTGFDMRGKTVGIVGTGLIGRVLAGILRGFGCRILGYDVRENPEFTALGGAYVSLDDLFASSDVISLHTPLTPQTRHLIDARAVARMKPGVMLINTSRGAVVDTSAVIEGLKSRKIGHLGLDVYEEEEAVFFQDLSSEVLDDDELARLLTFPNVIVTSHQGFLTIEALEDIARTTLENLSDLEQGRPCPNAVDLSAHTS
ncbi:MAG: 2-hydroxyacid dehydrogenase [Isosphaeraceae bacterium]